MVNENKALNNNNNIEQMHNRHNRENVRGPRPGDGPEAYRMDHMRRFGESSHSSEIDQEALIDLNTLQDRIRIDKDKIKEPRRNAKDAKSIYTSTEKKVHDLEETIRSKVNAIKDMSDKINELHKNLKIHKNKLELLESQAQNLENVKSKQEKLEEDKTKADQLTKQLNRADAEINRLNQEIDAIDPEMSDLKKSSLKSHLDDNIPISEKLDIIDMYGDTKLLREKLKFLTEKTTSLHSEIQKVISKYNPDLYQSLKQDSNTIEVLDQSNSHQKTHHQLEIDPLIKSLTTCIKQFTTIAQSFLINQHISSLPKEAFESLSKIQITNDSKYATAETFIKQYIVRTQEYKDEQERLTKQIESSKKKLLDNSTIDDRHTASAAIEPIRKKKMKLLDDAITLAQSITTSSNINRDKVQKKYNSFKESINELSPLFSTDHQAYLYKNFEDVESFYTIMKQGEQKEIIEKCNQMQSYRTGLSRLNIKRIIPLEVSTQEKYSDNVITKTNEWEEKVHEHDIFQLTCIKYYKEMCRYLQKSRGALIDNIKQNIRTIIQDIDKNQTKRYNLEENKKLKENERKKTSESLNRLLSNNNIDNKKNQLGLVYMNIKTKQAEIKKLKDEINNFQLEIERVDKHKKNAIDDLISNDNIKADTDNKAEITKSNYIDSLKVLAKSHEKHLDTLYTYSDTIQASLKDFSENNQHRNELLEYIKKEISKTEQQYQKTLSTIGEQIKTTSS